MGYNTSRITTTHYACILACNMKMESMEHMRAFMVSFHALRMRRNDAMISSLMQETVQLITTCCIMLMEFLLSIS